MRNIPDLPTSNPSTPRGLVDATGPARRRAATHAHLQAVATINTLFDRVDELTDARGRLTGMSPLGASDDPIRDAETLLHHAALLAQVLTGVRAAAVDASAHRRRSDLAADIGTKVSLLFPRARRVPTAASISDDDIPKPVNDDPNAGSEDRAPDEADRLLSAGAEGFLG